MKISSKILFLVMIVSAVVTAVVDRLLLQKTMVSLHRILALEGDIVGHLIGRFHIPHLSVVLLAGFPLLVCSLFLLPYSSMGDRHGWAGFATRLARLIKHFFWIPFLALACELAYKLSKVFFPGFPKGMGRTFSMVLRLFIFDHSPIVLHITIAGALGILMGVWCWYAFGFRK
ncbi:MAG: hypothetical protein A4E58_01583 [Syntrophorhabdus sp. PtaB.Bin006]|nr:MAG: hypothetical protein A4E58_01583 [Syntrophorhabdus sp. PtaB.Bin006]